MYRPDELVYPSDELVYEYTEWLCVTYVSCMYIIAVDIAQHNAPIYPVHLSSIN